MPPPSQWPFRECPIPLGRRAVVALRPHIDLAAQGEEARTGAPAIIWRLAAS
jgi:hypothetical protein